MAKMTFLLSFFVLAESCTAANVTNCPQGGGSGCPPFAKVICKNSICYCDRS